MCIRDRETSARYVNTINDKEIYYIVLNYEGFFGVQKDDIFIILTDNTMKKSMVRTTSVKIIISCIIAFAIGYLIIFIWISRLVDDTKRITRSLRNIGEDHYKTKVTTKRSDEIGELVESIELMRNKIIEHEKQKQDIIQGVSHDLKTPIALIQSYAEALEDDMCDKKEMVDITLKQCNRLNSKVTKLLNITRLGYMDVNKKTIGTTQMDDMIRELVASYSYRTKKDIEQNLLPVSFVGDRESWLIAVQNILDNALRFAKTKIVITLKEDELTIYNDGKHIDEGYLPNIFSAYEKTKDSNFGLGLSIVRRTAQIFGYNVTAENMDVGVQFTIYKIKDTTL
jgi:two-component system sensor histidine kinase CssS